MLPGLLAMFSSHMMELLLRCPWVWVWLALFLFVLNTFYNVRSEQGKLGLNQKNHRSNTNIYTFEKLET